MSSVSMPIVAILAAVYVAGVAGAAPDLAGYAHRVVCESFRDGNWELYVMNADGSDPVNLTQTDDVHELYPHASPDGLRICFVADRGEGRERTRTACVMNVDGSERIEIGPGRQPCWHPDGGAIAYLPAEFTEFTFMDYATRGIEVYDVVAKTITKHPNDAIHHLYNLCYAAGGDWFVATVHGGMGYDHAILAIEASGTRVVDLGIGGCRPDISPDGTKIAWGPSDWKLQIADISFAGDEPKVTNRRDVMTSAAPNKIYHIDWSPDGRYVAFSRGPTKKGLGPVCELVGVKADGWDICVADAAATNDYSIITTGGDSNKEADWVPAASEGPSVLKTGSGIEMALLPGGWFEMGNDDGESDEAPVHRVWVDSFLIDRYEMTQEAYSKFVLANPSHFKGDSRPVEQMSWAQAALCCNERSRAEGLEPCYDEDTAECNFDANGYRLPT